MGEKAVLGIEGYANRLGAVRAFAIHLLPGSFEIRNHRRRGIHLEALTLFDAGECIGGRVRRRVGGHHLDLVSPVGNQRWRQSCKPSL